MGRKSLFLSQRVRNNTIFNFSVVPEVIVVTFDFLFRDFLILSSRCLYCVYAESVD